MYIVHVHSMYILKQSGFGNQQNTCCEHIFLYPYSIPRYTASASASLEKTSPEFFFFGPKNPKNATHGGNPRSLSKRSFSTMAWAEKFPRKTGVVGSEDHSNFFRHSIHLSGSWFTGRVSFKQVVRLIGGSDVFYLCE